jgi:hypothetical protein
MTFNQLDNIFFRKDGFFTLVISAYKTFESKLQKYNTFFHFFYENKLFVHFFV